MRLNLIGADPEVFLMDKAGNFVSSIGKFGGSKLNPLPIPGMREGFAIQEDNVTVEFNIPPSRKAKQFSNFIKAALDFISEKADKMDLTVAVVASALFPKKELDDPRAQAFGCEADLNIWTGTENPRPKAKNKRLRSCGGHIHMSYRGDQILLGKLADLFIGCPSIMFDPDTGRRELYGKAGACRQKEYGLEYRVPSNFWVRSEDLTEMVFEQAQRAIAFADSGKTIRDEDIPKIQQCINNSDQNLLRELTATYKIPY